MRDFTNREVNIKKRQNEKGNVLFIILMAIALIGTLTAVIQNSSNSDSSNIDDETLSIKISEIRSYTSELERAVLYINQNGISEEDIRFAHPDANSEYGYLSADTDTTDQVFHKDGGAALYRSAPSGLNDGSAWEFTGSTAAPNVGTSRADLIAVLPNVTAAFCSKINEMNGQSSIPDDTSDCVYAGATARFDDATQYASSPNTMNESTFTQDVNISSAKAAPQACVACADGNYYFYNVLLAR